MGNSGHGVIRPTDSMEHSLSYERLCNFIAVLRTRDSSETLNQLLIMCLVILPDERFENATQLHEAINVLFGVDVSEEQVHMSIDALQKKGIIMNPTGTAYTVSAKTRKSIKERVDKSYRLEETAKREWLEEVARTYPRLSPEKAWEALVSYLAKAFSRHGLQTVTLLNPSIEIESEHYESLSSILNTVVKENFPKEEKADARKVISGFLAAVGEQPDRAQFIAQLADSTFNYYSLVVAPDVAEHLIKELSPLTLFLDTNFIFGILNLNTHPQVSVSHELLSAIKKHNLPFELRYHPETKVELEASIAYYGTSLRTKQWPRALSRAATTSRYLSGIELRYHQMNAERGIDVPTFLQPYKHIDVLLNEKDILIYNAADEESPECADMIQEYSRYLDRHRKEKPYVLIEHDATVLFKVRQLRSKVGSSLEAGALLLTCDYNLYHFDWDTSRASGVMACTVLPNLLWQILRPFIPADVDFDRSFAETFAIPEFRTLGSGSSQACSRLMTTLATFDGLQEETAARMLSNDLLLDKLRPLKDEAQFQEMVESAVVEENALLMEEKAAIEEQLIKDKAEMARQQKMMEEEKKESATKIERIEAERIRETERADQIEKDAEEKGLETKKQTERIINIYRTILALIFTLVACATFELLVNLLPWKGFINHSRSTAIQAFICLAFLVAFAGLFRKDWRKWCWSVTVIVAVVIGFLSIL